MKLINERATLGHVYKLALKKDFITQDIERDYDFSDVILS